MQKEIVLKHRVDSASRSQRRKLEQATLQVNSNQPLTKMQAAIPADKVDLYKSVNVQHVINDVDYAWNHFEKLPQKQLDLLYLPHAIAGCQFAYNTVKKKIIAEQAKKQEKQAERQRQNQEKHLQFEQRKLKNEQIYAKIGLKKGYQSVPGTQFTEEPLFQRLSKPKQSFVQESTYDLPDFRGFPVKNLTSIDKHKNPALVNHFMSSNLLPRSVFKDKMPRQFEQNNQEAERLQTTIQIDEQNMDGNFKDDAMLEIDQFEKMISTMPQTMYSQVKDRENQLLQSVQGFKAIKKIRNNPQYKYIIGNQIRDMVLRKQ